MAHPYDDRQREYRGGPGYEREHRNFIERAGDEVKSWFGGDRWEGPDRWRDDDRWRAGYGRPEHRRWETGPRGWDEPRPYSNTAERMPRGDDWRWRSSGESRGIYEDDSGQVHRFTHWQEQPNYAGRGPKGYRRSDDRIREDVCDRLTDDWHIDASEMEVAVQNGEVMLSGTVQSRDEKRRAEDLAERIAGVRDVHNNLRVTGS